MNDLDDYDWDKPEGPFGHAQIKRITLPSTLRVLGDGTFQDCR